ncbi:PAS domain-containing sensor histidine kinase [Desulfurispira natronophila]|uniref:histidine kinase n=1 Tax=Desulfurispira natronophila TaxID=682562 RepID=A0A7W8DFV7_9BACT|nr:PAS domain-containing sensor histidine kinase [Desulfurispira natronophila]MBB5020792.1 PAS domain S-box-containing protein [Desulfurispira natronophila]
MSRHQLTLIASLCLCMVLPAFSGSRSDLPAFGHEMFERHGSIMLLIDIESGAILDANQAALDFYGYSYDEMRSMRIQEINTLSASQVERERLLAAREQRNYLVFRHILANGDIRDVEVSSWPIEIQGRTVLFSIIHDITPRVVAEQELLQYQDSLERQVEQRTAALQSHTTLLVSIFTLGSLILLAFVIMLFRMYRKQRMTLQQLARSENYNRVLFDKSRIPLVVMDGITHHYTDANSAAIEIYGLQDKTELLQLTPLDVSARVQYDGQPSRQAAHKHIQKALDTGSCRFEWLHQRSDGTQWDADVYLMRFEHEGHVMLQFSLLDITARKRMEVKLKETLQRMQEQIDEGVERQRQQDELIHEQSRRESLFRLLVNLAHQWRQPLNVAGLLIQNIEYMLESDELDKAMMQDDLRQAMEQLQEISRFISELTDLYEEQGRVEEVNVLSVCQQAIGYIEPAWQAESEIIVDIAPNISLQAVPADLVELFMELVQNAITVAANRNRIPVTVEIRATDLAKTGIEIRCTDNAGGIDNNIISNIFDPYVTSEFKHRGKGMGLYHLQTLVKRRYDGTIQAVNTEEGAQFIVVLRHYCM